MKRRRNDTAKRIRARAENSAWFYGLAFELSDDDDIEVIKLMSSVFKKDGKQYYIFMATKIAGQLGSVARQRNFKDYKIIAKQGIKTAWAKGEWQNS